ncbi:glycine--tRNA ligase subunit beta [Sinimarinibacterium sp. NLF-5-8]|uniref:glycine--tRNA ligase subunit beta n=1 Tax=Sinimarinibacterium sp. NLF-5-8 TaxID=2698684 RepID=UPI00137C3631|nr:glycine--tRNA ligase subunit beta [Sinimarinibacterium sp. NLF-5-8]QHS10821.1 glycine--tRNA ligase subunit beta [Sinimarinibacterium sp. NLF-5-8]
MSSALLLEIGTEDLPARYVLPLADALLRGISEGFTRRGIGFSGARRLATPRRLALVMEAVDARQSDQVIERLGPSLKAALKDGAPTPAALGFARSCGVDFAALGEKDGKLHFSAQQPGQPTADLLPQIFEEALKQMDALVPKRMRWGDGDITFVRPVQWLTCLLGENVVPLTAFGLTADRITYGHRFHAPQAITLRAPAEYETALRNAKVWADADSRTAEVKRQIQAEAQKLGGHVRMTESLVEEVSALVEWPVAIVGRFESTFLQLPPEVIVATVETNQRYFTVFEDAAQTRLTNAFITLANVESRDVSQIISGNERVVRPRLSDALFFWQQDRRRALADYAENAENVTYQRDLGSLAARVTRLTALAQTLAQDLGANAEASARAAALCKCDLSTAMVGEFPELQGIMGGYYAAADGETEAVAQAIREHYLPTQHGTPIPASASGQIVALADKLDALAGIFAIGQKPTASKDPFALRRAALGVLRISIEGEWALDVRRALQHALQAQPTGARDAATLDALVEFVMERLRAHLVGSSVDNRAVSVEVFESVKALGITAPLDFVQRLHAVHAFINLPDSANLAAANKRIHNLLKQAGDVGEAVDPQRFTDDAERALFAKLSELEAANAALSDYWQMLNTLGALRAPVDAFFEHVMVNDPDTAIRNNRLALLKRLEALCCSVADLSQLPG